MHHTYFDDGSIWKASGTYFDENGKGYAVTGRCEAKHDEAQWSLDGYMEVAFPGSPTKFFNKYSIRETDLKYTLSWISEKPALGTLRGVFELVGDSVISFYTSDTKEYAGTETLTQLDEDSYDAVGAAFQNGKRMSAWTVSLKRVPM